MISKKKGVWGAAICLVVILLSLMATPTYSRYVLYRDGAILETVVTAPQISVTFVSNETEIHKDESLSSGMTLTNLSYNSYTVTADDVGSVTKNFTNTLTCPECGGSIEKLNSSGTVGCVDDACGVTFDGWMNAAGNFPHTITVVRNLVLNAKWHMPNIYHLFFVDLEGNMVLQKKFTSDTLKVEITGDDVTILSNAATEMSEKLTQDAGNTMTITATWGDGTVNYLTPGKVSMASASDITVRMDLSFDPASDGSSDSNLKLQPQTDSAGNIIDENGDGYPDAYKITGIDKTGTNDNFMIPDYILKSPVTEIEDGAFSKFEDLRDVFIPNTVTYIGAEAFSDDSYPQIQIFFDGTRAQWDALVAASDKDWADHVGTGSVVVCLQESPAGYYERTGVNGLFVRWTWRSGEYKRGFGESG